MPNWDEDSPELRRNLSKVLDEIVRSAQRREFPTLASVKRWQSLLMKNLTVPDVRFVGVFRGEPGLEKIQVRVGVHYGVDAAEVAEELAGFERKLHALLRELDLILPAGEEPDADQLAAVLDLCAWVHAEWVRIHPFATPPEFRLWRGWRQSYARRLEADRSPLPATAECLPRRKLSAPSIDAKKNLETRISGVKPSRIQPFDPEPSWRRTGCRRDFDRDRTGEEL